MSPRKKTSDQVPILLPNGEETWVSPGAFNLISEQQFQDSKRLRRLRTQRNLALVIAAVALLVFTVDGLTFLVRLQQPSATQVPVEATDSSREKMRMPPIPAPPAPAKALSNHVQAAPLRLGEEITTTVNAWADAWSAQDVERYLSFYSLDFRPPDGLERPIWETLRRQRIERPASVEVTVGEVETARLNERTAIVRFTQRYRSPGYQDWVLKTLELTFETERWQIVSERSSMIERGSLPSQTLAAASAGSAGQ